MKTTKKRRKVIRMPHPGFAIPDELRTRCSADAVWAEFKRRFPHTHQAIAEGTLSPDVMREIVPVLSDAIIAPLGQRVLGELADSIKAGGKQ